jgi:hypothetical protein
MQREVSMAKYDPKTEKLVVGREMVEVERSVTVRHNGKGADRVLNDTVAGRVIVPRGATVTIPEMSKSGVDDLRRGMEQGAVLELVMPETA